MPTSVTPTAQRSLQDFTHIKGRVEHFKREHELKTASLGFSFFILDLVLGLQIDEIEEAMTDTFYLQTQDKDSSHDRGIDAVYIDNSETPSVVHLFSFKYTESFEKTVSFFPANEIDKILYFLYGVMQKDVEIEKNVNKALFAKIEEIWDLFSSQNPKFVIHICSNFYNNFELNEGKRFDRELDKYSFISVEYHSMPDIVQQIINKNRIQINGKIKAIDKNIFEKSGGDVRALIVEVEARDLLRLIADDESLRNNVNLQDYSFLRNAKLLSDVFVDNVRIYLKQSSKINQNIKNTALDENENHRFFFYNNGITITCSHFNYPRNQRGPVIELNNIQVVNGGQTLHALFEAFQEDINKFENIELLCRIYETANKELSASIAEYTNSQNPVKSRDVRSNDYLQKKLEMELQSKGYFYERKKSQFQNQPLAQRIDAEKAGQLLMAFFNEMPSEAKDKKRLIFAEKYDEVFHDSVTADDLLLSLGLFNKIEVEKKKYACKLDVRPDLYDEESFVLHASYYVLYLLKKIAMKKNIAIQSSNIELIFDCYSSAINLIKQAIEQERKELKKDTYSHRVFFKGNRPKKHLENLL